MRHNPPWQSPISVRASGHKAGVQPEPSFEKHGRQRSSGQIVAGLVASVPSQNGSYRNGHLRQPSFQWHSKPGRITSAIMLSSGTSSPPLPKWLLRCPCWLVFVLFPFHFSFLPCIKVPHQNDDYEN